MEDTNSLIEQRKAKLAALREKGVDPFKNKFHPDSGAGEARGKFEAGELAENAKVSVAGRISAHREMGKRCSSTSRTRAGASRFTPKNRLWVTNSGDFQEP